MNMPPAMRWDIVPHWAFIPVTVMILLSSLIGDVEKTSAHGTSIMARSTVTGVNQTGPSSALQFNGDDYVTVPDGLIQGITVLTLEAWFKTNASGVIFGYQNVSIPNRPRNYVPAIYIGKDGKARGQLWNGSVTPISSGLPVNDGAWHHVALVAAAKAQNFYIDGRLVGTLSGSISHLDMAKNQLGMGYAAGSWPSGDGWFGFSGLIDEVRIWSSARTQDQIRASMNQRLTGSELGLAGYWAFDEGGGTVAEDRSGNSKDGQLGSTLEKDGRGPIWVPSGVLSPTPDPTPSPVPSPTGRPAPGFSLSINGVRVMKGQHLVNITNGTVAISPAPGLNGDFPAHTLVTLLVNSGAPGFAVNWAGVDAQSGTLANLTLRADRNVLVTITLPPPTATPIPIATPTPTPAATPLPTSTPAPTPVPDCGLGEPCVHLYATQTQVPLIQPVLLDLSIVNSIAKPRMSAQLIIQVPSGWTLSGSGFNEACTGQCSAVYEVPPGGNRSIGITLQPNQSGEFEVTARLDWFFWGRQVNPPR